MPIRMSLDANVTEGYRNIFSFAQAQGNAFSNYPPAEPGALGCEPLEAADGVADAAPVNGGHLKVASQRHRFICSRRLSSSSCFLM
jgi:hypothetical protein